MHSQRSFRVFVDVLLMVFLVGGFFLLAHPAYGCACDPPVISFTGDTPANSSTLDATTIPVGMSTSASGSSYSFVDFDHSLVGWWRFENNSNDDSGIADSSTWSGTEAYDSGRFGQAASFDGATSLDVVLHNSVNSSFTVSAWVNLNTLTEAAALVSDDEGQLLQIGGSSRWQFDDVYSADSVATTSAWTHVVGVYDAPNSTESLYVDGMLVISGSSTRSIGQNVYIGKRADGFFIDGKIDDVMILKRALSSGEISSLYDAEANQYSNTFTDLYLGPHTFTGYAVDSFAQKTATDARSVSLVDSSNLLTNPGAETGDFTGWTIDGTLDSCGDFSDFRTGWCISGAHYSGNYGFISSYPFTDPWATMSQEVDLVSHDLSTATLDSAPDITASTHVLGINENGGSPQDAYRVIVTLLDADRQVVTSWSTGDQMIQATDGWISVTHTFSGYGSGVRYITFEQDGYNNGSWGGAYGAVFDDSSLTVDAPRGSGPIGGCGTTNTLIGTTVYSTTCGVTTISGTITPVYGPGYVPPATSTILLSEATSTPVVLPQILTVHATTTFSTPHFIFNKNLFRGMIDMDVKELQQYLNTEGFLVASVGFGSVGNETTYFGAGTKTALIKFQKAKNIIPVSGYFGPITRAYINSH